MPLSAGGMGKLEGESLEGDYLIPRDPSFFSNRYISPRYESKIYHRSLLVLVEKFGGGDVDALIISFCWSVLLVALSVYMYMRVNLRRGECDETRYFLTTGCTYVHVCKKQEGDGYQFWKRVGCKSNRIENRVRVFPNRRCDPAPRTVLL